MAIPTMLESDELNKFADDGSGNPAVRVLGVTATVPVTGPGLADTRDTNERNKFLNDGSDNPTVLIKG